MIPTSGTFNVGLVAIRNTSLGRACLERWHQQCIEVCVLDGTRGLCGDQGYLDEWPARYDRLTVLQHKGAGLAPWNVEQYTLSEERRSICVDSMRLIFYHFHGFRLLRVGWQFALAIPSLGYDFTPLQLRLIYKPYVRALVVAEREVLRTHAGKRLPPSTIGEAERAGWRRWRIFRTGA